MRARVLAALLAICPMATPLPLNAADRTTLLIPLGRDASGDPPENAVLADEAFGKTASRGWKAYLRVWQAHLEDPSNASVRRFLGLPLDGTVDIQARRGRSAPRWLGWKPGTFAQVDTRHFVIYSQASETPSRLVAQDLERCYWVWTQMFFPLWEAKLQVSAALADMPTDRPASEFLEVTDARISIRRKLRVVLFRDAAQYQKTLGKVYPGIEQSTGFYDNGRQTIYLYAAQQDDAATRRHELVHQLFREATRSGLGRSVPGEQTEFWLIEGIAGYFESLHFFDSYATVGGWDASRLQFARYRMLAGQDWMPLAELRAEGRLEAQRRSDLARWYAHAIARTHQFMDGGDSRWRAWVYQQLSQLYKVKADLVGVRDDALGGADGALTQFLSITDAHLVENQVGRPLSQLVLVGCEVTADGLASIKPSPRLKWLDLARLRTVDNAAVRRLAPEPRSIEQLTLEVTRIDNGLADWLDKAENLREIDLSFTRVDDSVVRALTGAGEIRILWMTGTQITDSSIDAIERMRHLQSVDVQRTKVSDAGLARLRASRPDLQINPLQLQ